MKINASLFTILLVSGLVFVIHPQALSQKKKPKKETKSEIKAESTNDVVEEVVFEEVVPVSVSNSNSNSAYDFSDINQEYQWFTPKDYRSSDKKYGIMDRAGKIILPPLFYKSYSDYSNGNVLLQLGQSYGLFNIKAAKWIIPLQYQSLSMLGYGSTYYQAGKNGSYGIIDTENKEILGFKWARISSISGLNNYLIVSISSKPNDLYGIYSITDGKLIVPCEYSDLNQINSSTYFKVQKGSKYNIIDINNRPKLKVWYDNLVIPSNGRNNYIVKVNNKMGIINAEGAEVAPLEYAEISDHAYNDGSYLARDKNGKYGFMRIDGSITLPFQYDNLSRRYNDNVISVQDGKCGIVQVNSGVPVQIVACNYDNIKQGAGDYVLIVEKDNKFGLLDKYGSPLTDIVYESLESINDASGLIYKGLKGGKFYLVDQRGEIITATGYDQIGLIPTWGQSSYYYRNNFNYMKAKTSGQFKVVDKVGREIVENNFDEIDFEVNNFLVVKSKQKYGIYSVIEKKLTVEYQYDQIVHDKGVFYGFKGDGVDEITINNNTVSRKPVKS